MPRSLSATAFTLLRSNLLRALRTCDASTAVGPHRTRHALFRRRFLTTTHQVVPISGTGPRSCTIARQLAALAALTAQADAQRDVHDAATARLRTAAEVMVDDLLTESARSGTDIAPYTSGWLEQIAATRGMLRDTLVVAGPLPPSSLWLQQNAMNALVLDWCAAWCVRVAAPPVVDFAALNALSNWYAAQPLRTPAPPVPYILTRLIPRVP